MSKLQELKSLVESVEQDYDKLFTKGVKAASPRIRKAMQEIKALAQEIRVEVQEQRAKLDK